jgi:hypothetical protein
MGSVKAFVTQHNPDVICFAMQEVANGPRFAQTLATEFAANYDLLESDGLKGMTKPLERKFCYTFVVLLIRSNERWAVTSHDSKSHANFKKRQLKPTKGGAIAQMEYHGLKISFAGTHLDSGSTANRMTHVNGIENAMHHGITPPKLSWFMGDLNYRLRRLPFPATIGEVVDMILSPAGRRQLYKLDSFNPADFPGFTFPDPEYANGDLIFPTYKRVYKPHGNANPCSKMHRYINGRGVNDILTRTECALCYSLSKSVIKKKFRKKKIRLADQIVGDLDKQMKGSSKRTAHVPGQRSVQFGGLTLGMDEHDEVEAYELGWLDRIGYKPGVNIHVNVQAYRDVPEVTLADHTPVFMVADVVWPDPK